MAASDRGHATLTTAPPRSYRPALGPTWWLSGRYRSPSSVGRWAYLLFMLRELTSVLLVVYLGVTLVQLSRLAAGRESYVVFLETLTSPAFALFHAIALVALLYHAVAWLNLSGIVFVVRVGGRAVKPQVLKMLAYGLWGLISLVVFVLFLVL
jgi:fumarate reductase subunit C